jgi:hypothetical protein
VRQIKPDATILSRFFMPFKVDFIEKAPRNPLTGDF